MKAMLIFVLVCTVSVTFVSCREDDCVCDNTKEYWPVCGSDGNTYANKGEVRCHNQCHPDDHVKIVNPNGPCH
ncbi:uncharacterized protein LOC106656174 [Trichogramma pretiosum]|uniref:uncharacterized protein LOC106656174 n=1 Tax=Trichogramma pretiosum TaxID=7493 RepID=UPI0006C9C902|nr:uncharacterized protein LOC106656174 [Trichogramma pretiosum]